MVQPVQERRGVRCVALHKKVTLIVVHRLLAISGFRPMPRLGMDGDWYLVVAYNHTRDPERIRLAMNPEDPFTLACKEAYFVDDDVAATYMWYPTSGILP